MGKILEAFASDNLTPNSLINKKNERYNNAMQQLIDAEWALENILGEREKKLLNSIADAQSDISELKSNHSFVYGYRLGVMMMMEVLNGSDDLVGGQEYNFEKN